MSQLEVLIRGVFDKRRLADFIRQFIVFEDDGNTAIQKMAGYHQFHAVMRALEAMISASRPNGNRHTGVVGHTQGSGTSLTMAFYGLKNPDISILSEEFSHSFGA